MSDLNTGLVLRLEAQLKKFESQMRRATDAGTRAASDVESKWAGTNRKMARSAEESAQAIGREMDRLRAKYDPVFAASKRYEAGLAELNRAQSTGAINANVHAAALDKLNAEYAQASGASLANAAAAKQAAAATALSTAATTRASAQATGFFNVSRGGQFVLQNTAAQLGDMAVQWEMGTAASRIAAQQLPQLFGGFSALGGALGVVAPMLGVVAAVGIPVAAMLMNVAGNSDDAAKDVKTFADRLDDAASALSRAETAMQRAARGGAADLRKVYGQVTLEVNSLAAALAEIEKRAAMVEVSSALDAIITADFGSRIGDAVAAATNTVTAAALGASAGELDALRREISGIEARRDGGVFVDASELDLLRAMTEELAVLEGRLEYAGSLGADIGISQEQVDRFRALPGLIQEAADAGKFAGVADAVAELRQMLTDLGADVSDGVLAELVRVEDMARQAAHRLDDGAIAAANVAAAAGGITSEVGDAANEAIRLARNLGVALAVLASIGSGMIDAQRRAANIARINAATAGDPVARAGALARNEFNEDTGAAAYAAIRSGRAEAIPDMGDRIEAGAREVARLEQIARELDAAASAERSVGRSGGGRSGGGAETPLFARADEAIVGLQRQIEMIGKTSAEVAELTARHEMLDEARKRGLDINAKLAGSEVTLAQQIDAQAAAIGGLTEQYEQSKLAADAFQSGIDGIADSMAGAVVDGENLGESFCNIVRQMARDLLASRLKESISGLFKGGGGGGGLGGFIGSLFGSKSAKGNVFSGGEVTAFASGGVVSAATTFPMAGGRVGLMGEAGPEAIMPLSRGADGKLGVKAARGGGGGGVNVSVKLVSDGLTLSEDGSISANLRAEIVQGQQRTVQTVKSSLAGWQAQLGTDGVL